MRFEVDGLVVRHHPEAPLRRRTADDGTAVLIGESYPLAAGSTVESVLDGLLAAESDEILFDRLDGLGGRFALLLLKDGSLRVFHDPVGSRSVFYRRGEALGVGSHAELVATAFGHGRSGEVAEFLASREYASRTISYLPGDLTLWDGVHALAPNTYYDSRAGRAVRYWPREPRRATSFDEFFAAVDGYLCALSSALRGRLTPIVGITGGIDTRTVIAAFRAHGLPFRGTTWLRRRGGIEPEERAAVEAMVGELGADHAYLELGGRMRGARKEVAAIAARNAGGLIRPSRIAAHMHESFAGSQAAFVGGYGGEILRGFYNLSPRQPTGVRGRLGAAMARRPPGGRAAIGAASATELLNAYDSSLKTRPGREYTRFCTVAFDAFIERASWDERLERSGFDLADVFYWEHRVGMWAAAKHNEVDAAVLSLAGHNGRRAFEAAFGLEPGERLTKELLREVIRRYDPRLADLPVV